MYVPQLAFDFRPGFDHMMVGWGWLGLLFMFLFWALVIGLIVWLIVTLARRSDGGTSAPARSRALEILEERYAKGEIDSEEFRQRKADLEG